MNDEAFLRDWRAGLDRLMADFSGLLRRRIAEGATVAGYGAPTKATLLMKVAGLTGEEIVYIVEDNALKTGRFLPGSAAPILPTAHLSVQPPDVLVIFAWNFADDIVAKLRGAFDKPVEVVVPLPSLRTLSA